MTAALDRMIYIDDSGHPSSGLVVYGWIEFRPDRWATVLRTWLDLRKKLWRDYRVPVVEELHATQFVNGRGRVSQRIPDRFVHRGQEFWKDLGRAVAVECLEALRSTEGLRVGAVWRRGPAEEFAGLKAETYSALIRVFEEELAQTDSLALVFMDGDGSDSSYRQSHRSLKLTDRRVLEDAIHVDSKTSQLMQMADLVAWSANVWIDTHPGNQFAWEWYPVYLAPRDPHRCPREI